MIARVLGGATLGIAFLALVTLLTPPATPSATPAATEARAAAALPTAQLPATNIATPSASALPALESLRISVPRLGIDLPLAYGDVQRDVPRPGYAGNTPERVALVFPGSAPLATGGNTYIYAHARAGMFLPLWTVRAGDDVIVYSAEDAGIVLRYSIVRVLPRVDPTDTTWLDPSGPERLTLQTSTGPNASDPRFIAIASRVDRATSTTMP